MASRIAPAQSVLILGERNWRNPETGLKTAGETSSGSSPAGKAPDGRLFEDSVGAYQFIAVGRVVHHGIKCRHIQWAGFQRLPYGSVYFVDTCASASHVNDGKYRPGFSV